jgi:hypothetical protein
MRFTVFSTGAIDNHLSLSPVETSSVAAQKYMHAELLRRVIVWIGDLTEADRR